MNAVEPFLIDIPEHQLGDLRSRLARTRWPTPVAVPAWDDGTSLDYLRDLCRYWEHDFDWRKQERKLNALPQFRATVDKLGIHFVHARGNGPEPFPLVLTHGWPSCFFELAKLIPLLTDPASHGGDPADAFDVVVPSLPGFGFSDIPREAFASSRVPQIWTELMRGLGYDRFGAHGGDLGGGVTARLGQFHPDAVAGIHVTNVYGEVSDGSATDEERSYLAAVEEWERTEGAYSAIQGTRPQTLAAGLADSPAGLASWIVEKYRAWSDCGGDIESVFSKDDLLTNITIYWVTGTIGSSFRPYWDSRNNASPLPWVPIEVPCGVAVFPRDIARPPRSFAERSYNITRWAEMPRGGHFAAMEQPETLAAEIQAFFRSLR
ncbi:MAG: hypothetical protein QOE13_1926 [Gaiellaceae bacterium]|nr:hypothetical protein [Gaiellaceae bacterium]